MIKKIAKKIDRIIKNEELKSDMFQFKNEILKEVREEKMMLGKLLCNELKSRIHTIQNIQDAEFKVFSQWGDDGIIQYLINKLDISTKTFIEFGVDNYLESNTRFLLMNNNWSGLVFDSSDANIEFIRKDDLYWKYQLTATPAFIDASNINKLIAAEGFSGETGLLHIDIDGNDYWIWKAIDVVNPVIAIIEYNSVFGSERAISIPYQKDFIRVRAHHSGLYAGASLAALCHLAEKKSYSFIGSNSNGNNAYFIRNDKLNGIRPLTVKEGYVESRFREHRDAEGKLTYLSAHKRLEAIRGLQVMNVITEQTEQL